MCEVYSQSISHFPLCFLVKIERLHCCCFPMWCVVFVFLCLHVRLMLLPCVLSSYASTNTAGCFIIIKKCSLLGCHSALNSSLHILCVSNFIVCLSAKSWNCVCAQPSDCSRFICLLNETRILHYSLVKPTKFSLQRGAAQPRNVCAECVRACY